MIDTHAHIYDSGFDEDREEMLDRAKRSGVTEIWMPNCNSESIIPMNQLAQQYPSFLKPMMGLHPTYVKEDYKTELGIIKKELQSLHYFMVGEIGLDYYWDLTWINQQEEAFVQQINWAKELNLPICIHSRNSKDNQLNAIERCCELIENHGKGKLKGIFHCFSGNAEDAQRIVSNGFLMGIGGVVTFKNGGIDKFLSSTGLEHLVLETDSPYLSPTPHRGKRNETAYLSLVVEKLADLFQVSPSYITQESTKNAIRLISS